MSASRTRRSSSAFTFLFCLGLQIASFAVAADNYDLTGRVNGLAARHHAVVKANGPTLRETTTHPDGTWKLASVTPGDYRITSTHPKYTFVPEYRQIALHSDRSNINFTAKPKQTPGSGERHTVSGRVHGLDGNFHPVIRAVGPRDYSTTVRTDGTWEIHAMVQGAYNVRPSHAKYTFQPEFRHVDVRSVDVHNVDFTAKPKPKPASR